jgi:hypothetical protein
VVAGAGPLIACASLHQLDLLEKQKKLLAAVKPCLDQLTQSGYFKGDRLIASAPLAAAEA